MVDAPLLLYFRATAWGYGETKDQYKHPHTLFDRNLELLPKSMQRSQTDIKVETWKIINIL